ncbi:hypothetical protein [Maribacter sp. 2-571]|uniref:hypothetical protein n=1 Tax=Maribacter sp. 2-571 TaxID=3417569 RepID=UPI003D3360B7
MSNPFKKIVKNAETSKSTMYVQEDRTVAKVSVKSCDSCGAPRPKNTNLVRCDYCRQPFMNDVPSIKSDT